MPLSTAESRLHTALSHYLDAVNHGGAASTQAAWTEKLRDSMVALDSLSTELSPHVDPRLSHFLESKSYRKAHDYLSALASSGLANDPTPRQACSR
ncbi:MAG: hypothetical protein EBT50_02340 [Verrucomicrobia bacterium]|nr:hypothetical protein [Verrucomicrobiota bacterium]